MNLAMNLTNFAVTEATGIAIAAYAKAAGRVFAVSTDGVLYEVAGATDAGAEIVTRVIFGKQDFGADEQKRASNVYVEGDADAFSFIAIDGANEYSYPMDNHGDGVFRSHVGRGLKGKRLQCGVEARNMRKLLVAVVLVDPLKRRV